MNVNLNHARCIIKIMKAGSISQASRELYISPSALSQTIHTVEEAIGVPVFFRKNGILTLTPGGEMYVNTAEQMIQMERDLENKLDDIKQEFAGRMVFGIPTIYAYSILPQILPIFHSEFPNVNCSIIQKGSPALIQALTKDQIDMALISGEATNHSFSYLRVFSETIGIFAPKGSASYNMFENGEVIDLEQVLEDHFIVLRNGHASRIICDDLAQKHGVSLSILFEMDDITTALLVAKEVNAIVCASSAAIKMNPILTSEFHFYPLKDEGLAKNLYVVTSKKKMMTRYMKRMRQLLQQQSLSILQ